MTEGRQELYILDSFEIAGCMKWFRCILTMLKMTCLSNFFRCCAATGLALCLLVSRAKNVCGEDKAHLEYSKAEYATVVQPLIQNYCLGCHSTKIQKGDLDLERFVSLELIRKDLKPWQAMLEMLESGEMPPKKKPQPAAEERQKLVAWTRAFLNAEALAHAGDPGPAALRRLSNAEYNYTIRDLTGVDLQPAREFPADGAAGEGFTNAAEGLSMSTALFEKYLNASKEIAAHAVLLPDGIRFSPTKTRRDWTDESLAKLRAFYGEYTNDGKDGKLPLTPYLTALVRQRDALIAGKTTLDAVAAKEKLSVKYLQMLWQAFTNEKSSFPMDQVRARWRQASEKDIPGMAAEISAWQAALWKIEHIGSYVKELRQNASDPAAAETQTLKFSVKPTPGQKEVVIYLAARDLLSTDKDKAKAVAVWQRPRFEGGKQAALLLSDYRDYGSKYEFDYAAIFGNTSRYLSTVMELANANDGALTAEDLAKKNGLDTGLLKRWIDILDIPPLVKEKVEPAPSPSGGPAPTLANTPAPSPSNGPVPNPSNAPAKKEVMSIPPNTLLAKWRKAACDPALKADAGKLADQVQAAFLKPSAQEKNPDRMLYDKLTLVDSPLLKGLALAEPAGQKKTVYGFEKERFGRHPSGTPNHDEDANIYVPVNEVLELRLPAALFRDREFVVEAKLDTNPALPDRIAQFQVLTASPAPNATWDGKSPLVANPQGAAFKGMLEGFAEFRRCFPMFICYPYIIPLDEIVCLKTFHREDEPLIRLFLNDEQTRRIDTLWEEHRFITRFLVTENEFLPLFIGFVTQDQTKELVAYFEGKRATFRKRAEDFEHDFAAAAPRQLASVFDIAARAYRRPLLDVEKTMLHELYETIRQKGATQEDALQGVLARVLVSPAFLYHVEQPQSGKEIRPVNDNELASRLSYFLWASMPDNTLREVAARGKLQDTKVLEEQTLRMLKDDRIRALAIEFGTQWIHVRGFDELKEKNEKLFPMFDDKLRTAIYEESVLFFQYLFQNDRAIMKILVADDTYLNETLAKHYGIPGVSGPQWRRVDGVKKYGRGGILGLASVQAKESGASRTSPVLRGNWVVETLLGEKLPRPPANVPRLPEEETGNDGLTMRQVVEKHVKAAECAVCHQRIDPFGFALEGYDPIGRFREKDFGGLLVDSKSKLKDGTEFEGMDGLRNYLLTAKKDVIVRLFCRRLLGYALCRQTMLSDQPLIDTMAAELNKNDGRISAAVLAIVRSPQFRSIRGADFTTDE